jgi:hypothetical protein
METVSNYINFQRFGTFATRKASPSKRKNRSGSSNSRRLHNVTKFNRICGCQTKNLWLSDQVAARCNIQRTKTALS